MYATYTVKSRGRLDDAGLTYETKIEGATEMGISHNLRTLLGPISEKQVSYYATASSTAYATLWGIGLALQSQTITDGTRVEIHCEKTAADALIRWGQTEKLGRLSVKLGRIANRRNLTVVVGGMEINVHPDPDTTVVVETAQYWRESIGRWVWIARSENEYAEYPLEYSSEDFGDEVNTVFAAIRGEIWDRMPRETTTLKVIVPQIIGDILIWDSPDEDVAKGRTALLKYLRDFGVDYLVITNMDGSLQTMGMSLV